MSTRLIKLTLITLILFIGSFSLYLFENKKTNKLKEGNYFVTGLDVDKVSKFSIDYNPKDGEKKNLIFTREGNTFYIESNNSYIADTKKVNDLIFKISNFKALKFVSSHSSDHENFRVTDNDYLFIVTFYDNEDNAKVKFYVGDVFKNKGNYLRHFNSDDVFLSDDRILISMGATSYVHNRFFNFTYNDIDRIDYKGKEEFSVIREKNQFFLESYGKEESDSKNIKAYAGRIFSLEFNNFFTPQESEVSDVVFDTNIKYIMNSGIIYNISLGIKDEKYFAKVNSLVKEMPKTIQVSQEADKDELQKVENLLTARGDSQNFNLKHGNWVYQIPKRVFDRLMPKTEGFRKVKKKEDSQKDDTVKKKEEKEKSKK